MKGRDINGQKEREKTVMREGEGSRSGTNSVCVIGLMIRERERNKLVRQLLKEKEVDKAHKWVTDDALVLLLIIGHLFTGYLEATYLCWP